jgi:hypothetical protein
LKGIPVLFTATFCLTHSYANEIVLQKTLFPAAFKYPKSTIIEWKIPWAIIIFGSNNYLSFVQE